MGRRPARAQVGCRQVNNANALLFANLASTQPPLVQTHLQPQHPRTWGRSSSVGTAAAAAAGTSWPSRDPASSGHEPEPPRAHPLVTAVAAVLLAVRDASARAAAGTRGAGRRLARLQVWLGKPEALLFREGCQLLACLMFILLYVWRYASVLLYLQLVLSELEGFQGFLGTTQAGGTEALTERHSSTQQYRQPSGGLVALPCAARVHDLQHLQPCGAWQRALVAGLGAVPALCSRLRAQDAGGCCCLLWHAQLQRCAYAVASTGSFEETCRALADV